METLLALKHFSLELFSLTTLVIAGIGIVGMEALTVWKMLHWYANYNR